MDSWSRAIRKRLGLSQGELAQVLGIPKRLAETWDRRPEPVAAAPAIRALHELEHGRLIVIRNAEGKPIGLTPSWSSPEARAAAWRHAAAAAVVRFEDALAEVREATVGALRAEREGGPVLGDADVEGFVRRTQAAIHGHAKKESTQDLTSSPTPEKVGAIPMARPATAEKYPGEVAGQFNTNVYPSQREALKRLSERTGVSVGELVRRGIEMVIVKTEE